MNIFSSSYSPFYAGSVRLNHDLRKILPGWAAVEWRRASRLEADVFGYAKTAGLGVSFDPSPDQTGSRVFSWRLTLQGRQDATLAALTGVLTPQADGRHSPGSPQAVRCRRGALDEVHGAEEALERILAEVRSYLPRQVADEICRPEELGRWVAESLARNWAEEQGLGAFHASDHVLEWQWREIASHCDFETTAYEPRYRDSYEWISQTNIGWEEYLSTVVYGWLGYQEGQVSLERVKRLLLEILRPVAEPLGVSLFSDGGYHILASGLDASAAREACRRVLTKPFLAAVVHGSQETKATPLCLLGARFPGLCGKHLDAAFEATKASKPFVVAAPEPAPEAAEQVLSGLELLLGDGRRLAAAWRSIADRHGSKMTCQGIRAEGTSRPAVGWGSEGGTSHRRWAVEFCLERSEDGGFRPESMKIRTSSGDGSGMYEMPTLWAGETPLVAEAFRRRLIADGRYQLALDAIDQGREYEVWGQQDGELDTTCTPEEALARGLELLHTRMSALSGSKPSAD